jgi:hypothetical protein
MIEGGDANGTLATLRGIDRRRPNGKKRKPGVDPGIWASETNVINPINFRRFVRGRPFLAIEANCRLEDRGITALLPLKLESVRRFAATLEAMPAPPLPRPLLDPARLDELVKKVVPGTKALILRTDAPTWAEPRECFVNVSEMIKKDGGEQVLGWSLFESLPDVLMEAEFHSVWRDRNGTLHDVTPKEHPALDPRTVFLPDPSLVYEGQQIDNHRVPLQDAQLIRSHIKIQEKKFATLNEGDLATYHGPVQATPQLVKLLDQEQRFLAKLFQRYYSESAAGPGIGR